MWLLPFLFFAFVGMLAVDSEPAVTLTQLVNPQVMICAIAKHEDLYIEEWVQYHKFLGFDFIHIYDNNARPSVVVSNLSKKFGDFVKVTHLPGKGHQIPVYEKCIRQYANNNTFGAFIDVDEFFVLRKHASIKDLLRDLTPTGGSLVVNWQLMGATNNTSYDPKPVVERCIHICSPHKPVNAHVKTIVYFQHALHPSVHSTIMKPGYPTVDTMGQAVENTASFSPGINHAVAYLNHYHTKSWDEYWKKKMRGNADALIHPLVRHGSNHTAMIDDINYLFSAHNQDCEGTDTFARDFYLKRLQSA